MEIRKSQTQKTYDAIANLYEIDFGKDREFFDLFVDPILNNLKSRSLTKKVVDLGSGPGNVVDYVIEFGIENPIVAVDFSNSFCTLLERKYVGTSQVSVIQDDMIHFVDEQPSNSVSAYITNYSFIHIPDEEFDKLLSSAHRSLEDGGQLSFAVWGGDKKQMEKEPYQVQNDTRLTVDEPLESYMNNFTEEEIIARLKKAGFTNIFTKTFKTIPVPGEFDQPKVIAYAQKGD